MSTSICPICRQRKAKRYCPAKSESICTICCGTEREVTIDCPPDCPHLIASRQFQRDRHEPELEKLPFRDHRVSDKVVRENEMLLSKLSYVICSFARDNPSLLDADTQASIHALAETYQTLAKGIVYEKPPEHRMQRELYGALKAGVDEYKQDQGPGLVTKLSLHDKDVSDVLVFFAQLASMHSNGRPKSRAFLHSLGEMFKPGTFKADASPLILEP
jgi:hypothetical protein